MAVHKTSHSPSSTLRHERQSLARLGLFIRTARKKQGLLQKQLAYKAGVNPRYLSRIEQGRINVSYMLLTRLLESLDLCTICLPGNIGKRSVPHELCNYIQDCVSRGKKRELRLLLTHVRGKSGRPFPTKARVCPFLCMAELAS